MQSTSRGIGLASRSATYICSCGFVRDEPWTFEPGRLPSYSLLINSQRAHFARAGLGQIEYAISSALLIRIQAKPHGISPNFVRFWSVRQLEKRKIALQIIIITLCE
jgi:hypothetical protein